MIKHSVIKKKRASDQILPIENVQNNRGEYVVSALKHCATANSLKSCSHFRISVVPLCSKPDVDVWGIQRSMILKLVYTLLVIVVITDSQWERSTKCAAWTTRAKKLTDVLWCFSVSKDKCLRKVLSKYSWDWSRKVTLNINFKVFVCVLAVGAVVEYLQFCSHRLFKANKAYKHSTWIYETSICEFDFTKIFIHQWH